MGCCWYNWYNCLLSIAYVIYIAKVQKIFYLEPQRAEKCAHGADDSLYWRGDDARRRRCRLWMGIYNKVGQGCMDAFSRRAVCWGEDAAKSLVPFQVSALCGGAWWRMLPRAHSPISAAIKRRARLLWMAPSANRNTYSVAVLVGCVPWVEALRTLTLSCNLKSCRRIATTSKQEMGRLSLATSYRLSQ